MLQRSRRRAIGSSLILLFAALAPAPLQPRQVLPTSVTTEVVAKLAKERVEFGAKAADLAWLYYSENRIDADKVYRWSRRAWEAGRDSAKDQDERVAATEAHLARMTKLEAKIAKIRKLGFGNSLDVAEVEYYYKEAEFLKAQAQGR